MNEKKKPSKNNSFVKYPVFSIRIHPYSVSEYTRILYSVSEYAIILYSNAEYPVFSI